MRTRLSICLLTVVLFASGAATSSFAEIEKSNENLAEDNLELWNEVVPADEADGAAPSQESIDAYLMQGGFEDRSAVAKATPAPQTNRPVDRDVWDMLQSRIQGIRPNARLIIRVSLCTTGHKQFVQLVRDGEEVGRYLISGGKPGYGTPAGTFTPGAMIVKGWSRKYNSPMPYMVQVYNGVAIHATGTSAYRYLGSPASHGCIRVTLENSKSIFNAVKDVGRENTVIVVQGKNECELAGR